MRECRDIRKQVLESGAAEGWAVTRHLSSCTSCVQWLADLQMAEITVKRLPVPEVPAGFESRMASAIALERGRTVDEGEVSRFGFPKVWIPVAATLAAAAVVAVVGAWLHPGGRKAPAPPFEQGVALKVSLNAATAIPGADVMFHLPVGVDLAGAKRSENGQHLAWRQDLPAGKSEFEVGLVAFARGDHRVDVVVCQKNECATGTVVVHAGHESTRLTSVESAGGGYSRLAVSVGFESGFGIPTKEKGI